MFSKYIVNHRGKDKHKWTVPFVNYELTKINFVLLYQKNSVCHIHFIIFISLSPFKRNKSIYSLQLIIISSHEQTDVYISEFIFSTSLSFCKVLLFSSSIAQLYFLLPSRVLCEKNSVNPLKLKCSCCHLNIYLFGSRLSLKADILIPNTALIW